MADDPIWDAIRKKRNGQFYVRWCAAVIATTLIWLVIQRQGSGEDAWQTGFIIVVILAAAAFIAFRRSREPDAPGKFRVVGVAKSTRRDVFLDLDAASPQNAKAKAEMEGIIVTKIYRIPEATTPVV